MGLELTDLGYGKELVYSIQATAYIDRETVEGLTTQQLARLEHHLEISRRVFTASVAGMVKGVRKYGPEPPGVPLEWGRLPWGVASHWFPHIFSEAVDCANQTGLFADALGVKIECTSERSE